MVYSLVLRGHLSMFRHASIYISHLYDNPEYFRAHILNSPYWNHDFSGYASTNFQEAINSKINKEPTITVLNNEEFLDECAKDPKLFGLYRMTFCITTQIGTSKDLNRVYPNSIVEKNTRYCAYKNGIEICKPWWWDDDSMQTNKIRYESAINKAELCYQGMINDGMEPEDTSGVLPLDTATKVIYTYSVNEWRHIIDLRYYGTKGVPHPNEKIVIGMVRDEINRFAGDHGIKYSV